MKVPPGVALLIRDIGGAVWHSRENASVQMAEWRPRQCLLAVHAAAFVADDLIS